MVSVSAFHWQLHVHVHCTSHALCTSVADPGGFHGFHGTPLSHESTADYVVSYWAIIHVSLLLGYCTQLLWLLWLTRLTVDLDPLCLTVSSTVQPRVASSTRLVILCWVSKMKGISMAWTTMWSCSVYIWSLWIMWALERSQQLHPSPTSLLKDLDWVSSIAS